MLVTAVVIGGIGHVLASGDGSGGAATASAAPVGAEPASATAPPTQRAVARVRPGLHLERAVPAGSGEGRRVVFSQSEQRVWLVDEHDAVRDTHLVSGSRLDNLFPGTYAVFSRSRHAVSYDRASTMQYFVRFTRGTEGFAIGFHDIPERDGQPVQSAGQLGTALSAGCIRQQRSDAIAVWEFATLGTTVVVTP